MDKDKLSRLLLATIAFLSLIFVVYASLVPLNYSEKPFDEAVSLFQSTPWFELGIERRADWVANGLIMLPAGFFASGAIDWRRKNRWPLLFAAPVIVALLWLSVIAIEFVQIWFPPRVVSQNDILAGVLGSVGGVLLWWISGRSLLGKLEQFAFSPPGLTKWKLLVDFSVLGLLIYNLMPLDVLISFSELNAKWNSGDIRVIPFQDFNLNGKSILFLAIAFARMVPYALVTSLHSGVRTAVVSGMTISLLFELVKVPIHSRSPSATGVIASGLATIVVPIFAQWLMRWFFYLDRAVIWLLAALGWTGVMIVGFLGRFDTIERDRTVLMQRFQGIFVTPFARAHASSEFEAGENILVKLFVFGVMGFLLTGWCDRIRTKSLRMLPRFFSVFWCVALTVAIELAQVALPPLVPDATDFILYVAGAVLGVVGFKVMVPTISELGTKSR